MTTKQIQIAARELGRDDVRKDAGAVGYARAAQRADGWFAVDGVSHSTGQARAFVDAYHAAACRESDRRIAKSLAAEHRKRWGIPSPDEAGRPKPRKG